MHYASIYNDLIHRARNRITDEYTECHHIIPRSMGGSEEPDNFVRLTIREHYFAHLLLAQDHPNQWFSVEAILKDTLNRNRPHRYKHPKLRFKRWIRRNICRARLKLR